jgi:hypothetical protein
MAAWGQVSQALARFGQRVSARWDFLNRGHWTLLGKAASLREAITFRGGAASRFCLRRNSPRSVHGASALWCIKAKNSSARPLNGPEDTAAGVLEIPEDFCTRFVRKRGNPEIRHISGILSFSNLSVFSAYGGFDSRRLHALTYLFSVSYKQDE